MTDFKRPTAVARENHGLDTALEGDISDLIEEQGKNHRNQDIQKEFAQSDDDRIDKNLRYIFELEHIFKIFQANEFGTEDASARIKILKGHDNAKHRYNIDHDHPDKGRDHHEAVSALSGMKDIFFLHRASLSEKGCPECFHIPTTLSSILISLSVPVLPL